MNTSMALEQALELEHTTGHLMVADHSKVFDCWLTCNFLAIDLQLQWVSPAVGKEGRFKFDFVDLRDDLDGVDECDVNCDHPSPGENFLDADLK